MKKTGIIIVLLFLSRIGEAQQLKNIVAEDNWGNPIHISDTIEKNTTVIVPFTTSNCGYCLIEGFFIEKNYLQANRRYGGTGYHMSLFNSQLDIYAFEKHFGWEEQIITYPPELRKLQKGGFPNFIGFKDGKQITISHYNYARYNKINRKLWRDNKQQMTLTGNTHLVTRILYENYNRGATIVIPKGESVRKNDHWYLQRRFFHRFLNVNFKNIDKLRKRDLNKHVLFYGEHKLEDLSTFFGDLDVPFRFSKDSIEFGGHRFLYDSVGIYAWFENPKNSEKYMMFDISNGNLFRSVYNYLDFVIYTGKEPSEREFLLYGHYDMQTGRPEIVPEKTFSDIDLQKYSVKNPTSTKETNLKSRSGLYKTIPVSVERTEFGKIHTIGTGNCRFPHSTSDAAGNNWLVYEENGDIILYKINEELSDYYVISADESDSYNPVVAVENNKVWVFYLNNKDTYYRVYGRYIENGSLSDEVLVSPKRPFTVKTLTVASNGDELSVAWSVWVANQRILQTRRISDGILYDAENIPLALAYHQGNYSNAWYPTLDYLINGELWGAWNQHYPGRCVIGGKIGDPPLPVTQLGETYFEWEVGGYPVIFSNSKNKKFVAYESDAWDVLKDIPQKIKISSFDEDENKWVVAEIISDEKQTYLNQTPSAVCDNNDNIIVAWSGRAKEENSIWGIYIAINQNGKWSTPVLISRAGVNSRYPKITHNKSDDTLRVSWHAGLGKDMKAEIIELNLNHAI